MYPTTTKKPPINLIFHKMYCIKMSKNTDTILFNYGQNVKKKYLKFQGNYKKIQ